MILGEITNGSITAELGHRTQNHVLNFLNLLIAVAVGLTYPLQAYAAIEVLERKLKLVYELMRVLHPLHFLMLTRGEICME